MTEHGGGTLSNIHHSQIFLSGKANFPMVIRLISPYGDVMKARVSLHPAFTLVEVLLVLAAIAIVGSIAVVGIGQVQTASADRKLEADVATINAAADYFLLSGGEFQGTDAASALTDLKARASAQASATNPGATGSFIDPRIGFEMQTEEEAARGELRAYWEFDEVQDRYFFRTDDKGPPGIKRFTLDNFEDPAGTDRDVGRQLATTGPWIWDHDDVEPTENAIPAGTPTTVAGPSEGIRQLQPPVFSPSGGGVALADFQPTMAVTIENPNAAGRLFFATNTQSRTEYSSALPVSPGERIIAWVESDNPAQWLNSEVRAATFTIDPHALSLTWSAPATVNYAAAGGAFIGLEPQTPGLARLLVNFDGIHPSFIAQSDLTVIYTVDGSDPATSETAATMDDIADPTAPLEIPVDVPLFGSNASVTLRALVQSGSELFADSSNANTTINIARTTLAGPSISPEAPFMLPNWMEMALISPAHPVGGLIYYTLTGEQPLTSAGVPKVNAVLYTGGFNPEILEEFTVAAQVAAPTGLNQWFLNRSTIATYVVPIGADSDTVGALVGSGNINGAFFGSLIFANPTGTINFNSQGRILGGDLYLPGTPTITVQPNPGTVVLQGQDYVPGAAIPRNVIGGKQYTPEGQLVNPQTDLRQIVDLAGDREPSNYLFRFNANSYLDGKLYRRANPPDFPTVVLPTGLSVFGGVTVGNQTVTLASGDYSNISLNNNNSVLRLGTPGATEPIDYIFRGANFNNGRIEVLSPVRVFFPSGFNINGVIIGDVNQPEKLEIQVANGGVNMNSQSTLAARLVAPNSNVQLNGTFRGSLIARTLTVNGNGVAFTLPPIIEGEEE
jgi:type II secretory pathway pseudopilin PulG